ncbi:hypothetical protein AgCh_029415 [Apium graveolens]
MGSEPLNTFFSEKEKSLKTVSEPRQAVMPKGSVQSALEKKYLDEVRLLSVRTQLCHERFGRKDIIHIHVPLSPLRIAVQIHYLDLQLRTKVVLTMTNP